MFTIQISERQGVDKMTNLGWREVTIVTNAGEIYASITDDGTHMEGVRFEPSPLLWAALEAACEEAER